jgi:predicted nucleic acid-binding protein
VSKKRTFIDSGILIAAARGTDELAERAFRILDDPDRVFVTSDLVRLEVVPKAVFHKQSAEAAFYEAFFQSVHRTVRSSAKLISEAHTVAEQAGLSAMDALHVAAAMRARCEELVTTEKTTKPMFRVGGLSVLSIRD